MGDKNNMNRKIEVNRKKYEQIRKMDHNQLKEYVNAIYEQGQASKNGKSVDEIMEQIAGIKGIGAVKLNSIRDILQCQMEK